MTGPGVPVTAVQVTGGAGGIDAKLEDLTALARLLDEVGDDVRSATGQVARIVADLASDLDMVVAAALSPPTAASAVLQTGQAAATLPPLLVATEGQALFLRTAVLAYRAADVALERGTAELQDLVGELVGRLAPVAALGAAAGYVGTAGVAALADRVGLDGLADELLRRRAQALTDAQRMLLDNPDAAEFLIGGADGLVDGLAAWLPPGAEAVLQARLGYPSDYGELMRSLSTFFRDGDPVVGPGGPRQNPIPPAKVSADTLAPTSVKDLLQGVDRRQDRDGQALNGEIGVVKVVDAQGVTRWIVQLPGTEVWPLTAGPLARDSATNVHTTAGATTVYMRGVRDALERAGVGQTEPVMLVGHSQGGMTATALAGWDEFGERFDVTHVVTAGSPIGRDEVPPGVQVLALENRFDVVPRLDGRSNSDASNVTTVQFDRQHHEVGQNHSLARYALAADSIPTDDPSYAAWRDSANGFLDLGNEVREHESERVTISRGP